MIRIFSPFHTYPDPGSKPGFKKFAHMIDRLCPPGLLARCHNFNILIACVADSQFLEVRTL